MRKESNIQNILIIVLAATVLVMSVGYATFSSNLAINSSTATFNKAVWDVRFDEDSFEETSTITADTTPTVSDNSVSFAVTLPQPGDTYTFKINAKNFGTIDANMKKITMSGVTAENEKFVSYTVNYNGTDYTSTTDGLNVALAAEATHTITVTVKYLVPENPADLPSQQDVTVNLTAAFDYEDALA